MRQGDQYLLASAVRTWEALDLEPEGGEARPGALLRVLLQGGDGHMAITRRKGRTGKFTGYQVIVSVQDPRTGRFVRRSVGTFLRRKDAGLAERTAKIAIHR
jgi:hypothetical protein